MRANPFTWALQDAPPAAQLYTFTDGDHELAIWLRRGTMMSLMAKSDLRDDLVEKYVTGSGDMPPLPFPAAGGIVPQLSKVLFGTVAGIVVLQAAPEETGNYTPEELVAVATTSPKIFEALVALSLDLAFAEDADDQKKSGVVIRVGSGETVSESPGAPPSSSSD